MKINIISCLKQMRCQYTLNAICFLQSFSTDEYFISLCPKLTPRPLVSGYFLIWQTHPQLSESALQRGNF